MFIQRYLYLLVPVYNCCFVHSYNNNANFLRFDSNVVNCNEIPPSYEIQAEKVKVKVKNILFQQDHSIVCINQKHQHSLVKKRPHKRENPAKNGQPRYK